MNNNGKRGHPCIEPLLKEGEVTFSVVTIAEGFNHFVSF